MDISLSSYQRVKLWKVSQFFFWLDILVSLLDRNHCHENPESLAMLPVGSDPHLVLYVYCRLPHLHGELIVNKFGKSLERNKDNTFCSATVFIFTSQGSTSLAHQLAPNPGSSITAQVLGDC